MFLPLWLLALFLLRVAAALCRGVSLLLNAWLNQRLFRYDALALHAGPRRVAGGDPRGARAGCCCWGSLLAPLSLIPFVNLIAPLYAGIAFTYLVPRANSRRMRSREARCHVDVDGA